MENVTGQPVRDADFFDREKELNDLWDLVENESVLLLAPRRVGKTSLLLRLLDKPENGWQCLYIDVMDAESEARFVARLVAELYRLRPVKKAWKALGDTLYSALRGVKLKVGPAEADFTRAVGTDWREVGERALDIASGLQERTLLLVDEIPIFVGELLEADDGTRRTRQFLNWFRSTRHALSGAGKPIHFLLAGSIGLDSVVSRAGLIGTIADLASYRLGPLTAEQSSTLLEILATCYEMPPSPMVRDRILERISWRIPYHLQLLFREVRRLHGRSNGGGGHTPKIPPALVDDAYRNLLEGHNRMHFAHWLERLKPSLWGAQELDLIKAVLRAAASDPKGISSATLAQLRQEHAAALDEKPLLQALQHDGYLVRNEGRWAFPSSLLRDWWRKYGP